MFEVKDQLQMLVTASAEPGKRTPDAKEEYAKILSGLASSLSLVRSNPASEDYPSFAESAQSEIKACALVEKNFAEERVDVAQHRSKKLFLEISKCRAELQSNIVDLADSVKASTANTSLLSYLEAEAFFEKCISVPDLTNRFITDPTAESLASLEKEIAAINRTVQKLKKQLPAQSELTALVELGTFLVQQDNEIRRTTEGESSGSGAKTRTMYKNHEQFVKAATTLRQMRHKLLRRL